MSRTRLTTLLVAAIAAASWLSYSATASAGTAKHERVLISFNSLCLSCKADASKIEAWSEREKARYSLLGVGFMMSGSDSTKFARKLGWRFPVEGDPAGRIASRYRVSTPTIIVLIDGTRATRINYASWATSTSRASQVTPPNMDPSNWLGEINYYRAAAGLSPVTDQPAWDAGLQNHITYLEDTPASYYTGTYVSRHTENPASPYYTPSGATEAGYSDLDEGAGTTPVAAIDAWLGAPFHAIGMLRAQLTQVGLALDPTTGYAALDVIQGLDYSRPAPAATMPILFPGPGATTDLNTFGDESPDPLETCGWQSLTGQVGLPVIALLPQPPAQALTATLLTASGATESTAAGDLCLVDEYTYTSSDTVYGPTGLDILKSDQAVILIPREPLANGPYTVDIQQTSQPDVSWSFSVDAPVPVSTSPPTILGTDVESGALNVRQGNWTNNPTSYAEQWERCDASGANCAAIPGATSAEYIATAADIGSTLRVEETASNADGTGSPASSAPTATIAGRRPPPPNTLLTKVTIESRRHIAIFTFKATGKAIRFQCTLVRIPRGQHAPADHYRSCGSGKTYTHVAAGEYIFYVRAVGPGGTDPTPASRTFTIA
jgi:hypothetical protein